MKHLLCALAVFLTACSITFATQEEKPKPVLKKQSEEDRRFAKRKKPFANRPILSVDFRGNTHISSERLREAMEFQKAGEIYDKEKLGTDIDRLRVLTYSDEGYLRAQLGVPEIEDTGDGLKITIPVLEGFRYRIGYIKIEDAKLLSPAETMPILGFKKGDVAKGYSIIQKGLEALKRYYKEHGYAQFNVDFSPDFLEGSPATNEATVDLTFVFEEGAVYTIGKITFKSKMQIQETFLRANLPIREGELYNTSRVDECYAFINGLGLYEELDPEEDLVKNINEKTHEVDIIIHLRAKQKN